MKHRFRTHGRWLALVAIAGASTVGLAPQAGAYFAGPGNNVPAMDVVNCTAAAAGTAAPDPADVPTIAFGTTNQAAGCWALKPDPGEKWQNGDVVTVDVDDAAGVGTPGGVFFSGTPTVKLGSQTLTNVTLQNSNKQLRVIVTGLSADTHADMIITGVKYDVDFHGTPFNTAYGSVKVIGKVNGNNVDPGLAPDSNAWLSDVSVTANDPEVGIDINAFPGTTSAPISDITIKEASTSAFTGSPVICIPIVSGNATFTAANVSKTAGDATALGITVDPAGAFLRIAFTVPATRAAANTFKVTNIEIDPNILGRVFTVARIDNDGDCTTTSASDSFISPVTTLAAIVYQERTGGSDRFVTARRIAEDKFGSADAAVIARADDFADALAASGLAGKAAQDTGDPVPILLTETNAIPTATLNALSNLGVGTVYIVGGKQAVSQAVEDQLRNTPSTGFGAVNCPGAPGSPPPTCLQVKRIAGPDRYGTAREIADFIGTPGTVDLDKSDGLTSTAQRLKTAFLARGDVFADALAVGPLAYLGALGAGNGDPMPILLTTPDALSPAAAAALIDNGVEQVIIAGGTAAVSQAVEDAVKAMGINVVRVAGTNRQHTAALVAGMAIDSGTFGFSGGGVILARGDTFPDALAAGPFGGDFEYPILLTENPGAIGVFTEGFLDLTTADFFGILHLVGQTAAVSDAAATQVRAALSGTKLAQF